MNPSVSKHEFVQFLVNTDFNFGHDLGVVVLYVVSRPEWIEIAPQLMSYRLACD